MNNKAIEQSIIKKFRKTIWIKFIDGINKYHLIEENDSIAVCLSGGKDSFLLAKVMQELQRHGQIKFNLKFICMNPGYNKEVLASIKKNAQLMNLDVHFFKANIFPYVKKVQEGTPCYLCARMRRGFLYDEAQKLGCNKIALGHHFNDAIETILMSMFYSGEYKTMLPKLPSDNFTGMELIRPLYLVKEKDIIAWQEYHQLSFIHCACPLSDGNHLGKRKEIKDLINGLTKVYNKIDINILNSSHNIDLNAIIGYRKDHQYYTYLDDYEKRKKK